MFYDDSICEIFIENGEIIKVIDASYQLLNGRVDGVPYTKIDIPCIHVVYKSGSEEWIACYITEKESYGQSHRKLIKQ